VTFSNPDSRLVTRQLCRYSNS